MFVRRELEADYFIEDIIISHVLTFQSESADKLANQTIILLGNMVQELKLISSRNQTQAPVHIRVKDISTGIDYTYKAYLRASDRIDNRFSSNVSFYQRRWATRKVTQKGGAISPPRLNAARDIGNDIISQNQYYVNIDIDSLVNGNINYYTYPQTDTSKLWVTRRGRDIIEELYLPFSDFIQLLRPEKSYIKYLVPAEDAERKTTFHPLVWGHGFVDGLLEKRIIVVGSPY